MDPSRRIGMLYAAAILLGSGALTVWTYRDPNANAITQLMDAIWKRFPPLAPIDYRTWYLVAGVLCAVAGLAIGIVAVW